MGIEADQVDKDEILEPLFNDMKHKIQEII